MDLILAAKGVELHSYESFQRNRLKVVGSRDRFYIGVRFSTFLDISNEKHMNGIASRRIRVLDEHIEPRCVAVMKSSRSHGIDEGDEIGWANENIDILRRS